MLWFNSMPKTCPWWVILIILWFSSNWLCFFFFSLQTVFSSSLFHLGNKSCKISNECNVKKRDNIRNWRIGRIFYAINRRKSFCKKIRCTTDEFGHIGVSNFVEFVAHIRYRSWGVVANTKEANRGCRTIARWGFESGCKATKNWSGTVEFA